MLQNFASLFNTLVSANLTIGGISAALAMFAANFWHQTEDVNWLIILACANATVALLLISSPIFIFLFSFGLVNQGIASAAMAGICLEGSIFLTYLIFRLLLLLHVQI
jgi:hypothetical protein